MSIIDVFLWFTIGYLTGFFTLYKLLPYIIHLRSDKIKKIVEFFRRGR